MKQRIAAGFLCFLMLFTSQGTIYAAEYIGEAITTQSEVKAETLEGTDNLLMDGTVVIGYYGSPVNLVIPDGVTEIAEYAFSDCNSLESVVIADSVNKIGEAAFQQCLNLRSVVLPEGLTTIEPYTFFSCFDLVEIDIPDSVTTISEYAFKACDTLMEIDLPSELEVIGDAAFQTCPNLTEIDIPSKVTMIGDMAFAWCMNLQKVTLPQSIFMIADTAFESTSEDLVLFVPYNSVAQQYAEDNNHVYLWTDRENYTLEIENGSLQDCSRDVMFLHIPDGVTSVLYDLCKDYVNLREITMADTVTRIGNSAFENCTNLKGVTFSNNIDTIGWLSFAGCTNLESVFLPESLSTIGNSAFNGCSNLKEVHIRGMETTIGAGAFDNTHADVKIYCVYNSAVYEYAVENNLNYVVSHVQLTFDVNGGEELEKNTLIVSVGQGMRNLPVPERKGYKFIGWYTDSGEKITDSTKPTNDKLHLTAQWEKEEYTITYHLGGGVNVAQNPSSYSIDSETIVLAELSKKGNVFGGWYADATLKTPITQIEKGSTGNVALYVKWIPNQYHIKYNGNGNTSGTMSASTNLKYDTAYTLKTNAFKKTGYSFSGWNTKADGTGTTYKDKASIKNLTATNDATIVLYAKWEKSKYTITYNLNGGKNSSKNPSAYTYTTDTITLQKPSKKGYVFAGWFTDSKLTNKVTKISKGSTGNKVLYAKWTPIEYNVVFHGNGNDSGAMKNLTSMKYDKSFTLSSNAFKKKGYAFVGWNTKADGSGISYDNKEKVKNLTSTNAGTINLYAQWEKKKYTITYKLNGGKNSSKNPATYTITSKTVTLKNPSRKGYEFGGWYSDSKFKNKVTKISTGSTGNKTFYAKWIPIKYKIAYVGNGATSGSMDKVTSAKYDKAVTLKSNVFKKKGYTFAGWNTKKDGSGTTYKDKASVENLTSTDGKTVKLYAQWKANKYYVKFVANDDDVTGSMSKKTYTYDKTYKLPKNTFVHKDGFKFLGWNTKANGKGTTYKNAASIKNLTSKSKKTITLYAMWGIEAPEITSITKLSYEKLRVRFSSVEGADGYVIYRSTSKNGTYKKVGTDTLWYEDAGLNADTTYYYKVRAYAETSSGDKIYSDYSKPVKGKTALRPSFSARVEADFGEYVSFVRLVIENKGSKRLMIGGNDTSNFCLYYPYEDAESTKGILVNQNLKEITGVYFDPGVKGAAKYHLEMKRFTLDSARIGFVFRYDECEYSGVAYANGYIAFEATGRCFPED